MASAYLLPAFRFEVKLLRSPDIIAGSQVPASSASTYVVPGGNAVLGGGATGEWNGAFQECGGLEIEMDVQEYQEGGRNNGVIRRVGRGKYAPLVLKRGMFHGTTDTAQANGDLWSWMQDILDGVRPVPRYDGLVYVMSADGNVRATWSFDRGLPSKIKGPELNGKSGEIAIEELTIQHEGLRLLPGAST